jgi:hypothetical protein
LEFRNFEEDREFYLLRSWRENSKKRKDREMGRGDYDLFEEGLEEEEERNLFRYSSS